MAKDIQRNITAALGVNRFADARSIHDEEVVETRDCYMKKPGVRASRPVAGGLGSLVAYAYTGTIHPATAGFLGVNTNNEALICFQNGDNKTHVARVDMDTYGLTEDKALSVVASYDATPLFAQVGGSVILLPGSPSVAGRGNGFSFIGYIYDTVACSWANLVFAGTGNLAINPLGVCEYKGRAVYWNLKSGMEDCILFADRDDPLVIGDNADDATTGRFIRIGSRSQGKIISCIPVQLSSVADPANTGLLILREFGAHLVVGEPNQSTETTAVIGDLEINDMNINCSCVSHDSVRKTPYGVIWLGDDDVWSFTAGSLPQRVGTKLRPEIIAQSNAGEGYAPSLRWKLFGAYFDGFYRLHMYSAELAAAGIAGADTPPDASWWLDLRDGMPQSAGEARWYGPQKYRLPTFDTGSADDASGLHCAFEDRRGGQQFKLLAAQTVVSGSDVKLAVLDLDESGVRDSNGVVANLNSPQSCIQPRIITKAYDVDDYSIDKIYTGLEIASTSPDRKMNVGVTVILDGTENSTTNRAIAQNTSVDQQVCYPNEDGRVVGKKVQLQINFQGGYIIDESNNYIKIQIGTTEYVFELTQGFYATLYDLMNHVCSVLTAGTDAEFAEVWSHNVPAVGTVDSYTVVIFTTGLEWIPVVHDTAVFEAFWNLIGFTSVSWVPSASQTADGAVTYTPACSFELHRATVRVNVIPRPLS